VVALKLTAEGLERDKFYQARNKIDLTQDGALEALIALDNASADIVAYAALAEQYPLRFHRDIRPVSDSAHARALALLTRGDKASLSIKTGAEICHEDPPRLSTGSLVMDWVLNGGIPRGFITQFKGAESLGKTFAALKACAEAITVGGTVLWCAAERFNKSWARTCGIPIPYSPQEMSANSDESQRALMVAHNEGLTGGDRFSLLVGRNGNEVLQTLVEAVEHNVFDLIVLDSIAVLRRSLVLDKKAVGDETMGGEAKLFNDFCTRLESAFNFIESRVGRVLGTVYNCVDCGRVFDKKSETKACPAKSKGKCTLETTEEVGEPLRSAVLVINQIRDRGIGSYIPQRPDAPGGRGLRHAKGVEIEFNSGEGLSVDYKGRPVSYGKRALFTCTKSKVGAPDRKGVVELHYETLPGISVAGTYNNWVDLFGCKFKGDKKVVGLAEMAGIVTQRGSHIYIGEQRFHGQAALQKYLTTPENQHVVQAIKATVLSWIQQGGF
jgi:RecA/RadA recombinase